MEQDLMVRFNNVHTGGMVLIVVLEDLPEVITEGQAKDGIAQAINDWLHNDAPDGTQNTSLDVYLLYDYRGVKK